jgi:hypothetical protein
VIVYGRWDFFRAAGSWSYSWSWCLGGHKHRELLKFNLLWLLRDDAKHGGLEYIN